MLVKLISKQELSNLSNCISHTYTYDDALYDIDKALRSAAILHKSHVTFKSSHYKWLNNLAILIPISNTLRLAHYNFLFSEDTTHQKTLRIHL